MIPALTPALSPRRGSAADTEAMHQGSSASHPHAMSAERMAGNFLSGISRPLSPGERAGARAGFEFMARPDATEVPEGTD